MRIHIGHFRDSKVKSVSVETPSGHWDGLLVGGTEAVSSFYQALLEHEQQSSTCSSGKLPALAWQASRGIPHGEALGAAVLGQYG